MYMYMYIYIYDRKREGGREEERGEGEWTSHAFWPCFTQWDSMLCHHGSCLGFGFAAQLPAEWKLSLVSPPAVERTRHKQDSQSPIMALA